MESRTRQCRIAKAIATQILPALRGAVSSNRRVVAHYADDEDALDFAGSKWAKELSALGTSCPDHFLRTRVCPWFIDWNPARDDVKTLKERIQNEVAGYRAAYKKYYEEWATTDSPKLRDSNPSVVVIPGLGLFGFGKNKKEARITTEFFINAIHVMAGANALEDGEVTHPLPQARTARTVANSSPSFTTTLRFRDRKHSGSSTGRWRKPNCSACLLKPSSAARSLWLSAEPAESAARSHCCSAAGEPMSSLPISIRQGATKISEEVGAVSSAEFVAATAVDLSSSRISLRCCPIHDFEIRRNRHRR